MDTDDAGELTAVNAISRLLFDYAYYLDMNQVPELADLFVDDCLVNYAPGFGAHGIAEYRKVLEGVGTYFSATSHHVSNVCVDFVEPTVAKVRSHLYAFHRYTRERPDGHFWGQYHDVVVLVDGQWRFKERELRAAAIHNFHVRAQIPIGRRSEEPADAAGVAEKQ